MAQIDKAVADQPELGKTADEVAREAAVRAILRDPLGVVALAGRTLGDFWDARFFAGSILDEMGLARPPEDRDRVELRDRYGLHLGDRTAQLTPLKSMFQALQSYLACVALAFVLVPICLLLYRGPARRHCTVLGVAIVYYNLTAVVFALMASGRFLLPVSWMLFLFVAAFVSGLRPAGRLSARHAESS